MIIKVTHYDGIGRYVAPWQLKNKSWINLLTPKDLLELPKDFIVYNIFGEKSYVSKCKEYPNFDVRGGFTAWGYRVIDDDDLIEEKFLDGLEEWAKKSNKLFDKAFKNKTTIEDGENNNDNI